MEELTGLLVAIGVILTQIAGFLTSFLKNRKENRKVTSELTKLIDWVRSLDGKITNVQEIHSVENKLASTINFVAAKIFEYNEDTIDDNVKTIINSTKKRLKDIANELYDSEYRNKDPESEKTQLEKERLEKYLKDEAEDIQKRIRALSLKLFPDPKKVLVNNNYMDLDYDAFSYHYTDLEYLIKRFIEVLVINGMSPEEYITAWEQFSENIFKCQIKAFKKWILL